MENKCLKCRYYARQSETCDYLLITGKMRRHEGGKCLSYEAKTGEKRKRQAPRIRKEVVRRPGKTGEAYITERHYKNSVVFLVKIPKQGFYKQLASLAEAVKTRDEVIKNGEKN